MDHQVRRAQDLAELKAAPGNLHLPLFCGFHARLAQHRRMNLRKHQPACVRRLPQRPGIVLPSLFQINAVRSVMIIPCIVQRLEANLRILADLVPLIRKLTADRRCCHPDFHQPYPFPFCMPQLYFLHYTLSRNFCIEVSAKKTFFFTCESYGFPCLFPWIPVYYS